MTTDRRIVRAVHPIPSLVREYGHAGSVLDMPQLVELPRQSYQRFLRDGLRDVGDRPKEAWPLWEEAALRPYDRQAPARSPPGEATP